MTLYAGMSTKCDDACDDGARRATAESVRNHSDDTVCVSQRVRCGTVILTFADGDDQSACYNVPPDRYVGNLNLLSASHSLFVLSEASCTQCLQGRF